MSSVNSERRGPDDNKLRELILLIAILSEGDKPFGATKLNKLLFYADFTAYTKFGDSITGQEYQKLAHGPSPRRLMPLTTDMATAGDIAVRNNDYFSKNQKRTFALREPDISFFTAEELELVQEIVKQFWSMSASEISDNSHKFVGWQLADMGETIPYEVALVGRREPNLRERAHGLTLFRR